MIEKPQNITLYNKNYSIYIYIKLFYSLFIYISYVKLLFYKKITLKLSTFFKRRIVIKKKH